MMTRVRKAFLSIGLIALLIGGAVTMVPPLLWGDHVDYSHVASIQDAREYQDRALLEKAWALPVAALYHANIEFQSNASFCGPTSIIKRAPLAASARQPIHGPAGHGYLDGDGLPARWRNPRSIGGDRQAEGR
jgi:hypothetical protein